MGILDKQAAIVLENILVWERQQTNLSKIEDSFWRRLSMSSLSRAAYQVRQEMKHQ